MSQYLKTKPHNWPHEVEFDRLPDECPLCHYSVLPVHHMASLVGPPHEPGSRLQIVLQCARHSCALLYIANYNRNSDFVTTAARFGFRSSSPFTPRAPSLPKEATELSPQFAKVYTQALSAEQHGLDEIAGGGYRKCLEFLVKDFCVHRAPAAREEIEHKFLGRCIEDYIDDHNIKACAKRAAWLGNDELHFVRRWTNRDIADLKILIDLTVGWVRNNLLTERYLSEMSEAS